MIISAVVAMSENKVIGNQNKLPWHLPADLKHFKKITLNKPIVMGRKTFESIGKPLPQRENIILTRDKDLKVEGCVVMTSFADIKRKYSQHDELCVIGGGEIFRITWPEIQRLYLTVVHADFEGDVFLSEFNWQEWKEEAREYYIADSNNQYAYSFVALNKS